MDNIHIHNISACGTMAAIIKTDPNLSDLLYVWAGVLARVSTGDWLGSTPAVVSSMNLINTAIDLQGCPK